VIDVKKGCIFLLALLLIFPGCSRAEALDGTLETTISRVQNAISSTADFVMADEDFTTDHIGAPDFLEESAVCFGAEGKTREFGVFRLSDRSKAAEFKKSLRNYLEKERQALSSLAELYPADELAERLALYENATVGSEGMLVYYFVLDKKETDRALEALSGR
jgi:hypothetical protein